MTKQRSPRYRLTLLGRFALYFGISAAGVFAALLSLEYQKFDVERTRSQDKETLRLSLTSRALQTDLREAIEDIFIIAGLEVMSDYIDHETAESKVRLEKAFLNFATNTRVYDQIRFIDSTGMERMRVNFDGTDALPVAPAQLQDKSQRYYFREALGLKAKGLYISPLDLNIEAGQIERPFKPVIRIVTPVFDRDGNLKGFIVLNYLAGILIDDFRQYMAGSWGKPMLVNPQGYWLSSQNQDDAWGFLLDKDKSFAKSYPEAWDYIKSHESGKVEIPSGMYLFDTVRPYDTNVLRITGLVEEHAVERYWKIITRISPQVLSYAPLSLIESRPRILGGLLLLVGILSGALARVRTNYVEKVQALGESEHRLAEAQRISHVGNWVWEIPTSRLTWSDEVYRIFGRQPQEFGASYEAFINAVHPDDRDRVIDAVNNAIYKNAPYSINHRVVVPDGSVRYVHERGIVESNAAGEAQRMLGTVQDITELVQRENALHESKERFRQLADNINEVFWLTEWPQNQVLYVSPAFERVWGISAETIYDDSMVWTQAIVEKDRNSVEQAFKDSAGKDGFDVTYQIKRPDGELRWIHDRAFIVRNEQGEVYRIAGVAQDITERKQAEKQLQKYREELEDMVAQRTAALEASNKELEAFSYSIAHDLRTPLRSITSFSQILQEEAGQMLSEDHRQDLQRIIKAGKYMAKLIDDILELARIGRAEFNMETVDLSRLAHTITQEMKQSYPQRKVKVDITPNLTCKGDARLLRIALENLIDNAWKYTSKCSNAHIEFGETQIDDKRVYFVRDNGVGFDMQYANKLFTPFSRLHKPSEYDGAGIGMASVLSAIQRHNGKVWAESREGEGTTVYFILQPLRSA